MEILRNVVSWSDCGLENREIVVWFPVGDRNFHLLQKSRTALQWNQPTIHWALLAISQGIKRPGREAHHTPSSGAKVEMMGAVTPNSIRFHGVTLNSQVRRRRYVKIPYLEDRSSFICLFRYAFSAARGVLYAVGWVFGFLKGAFQFRIALDSYKSWAVVNR
jgi:hypothetical protein